MFENYVTCNPSINLTMELTWEWWQWIFEMTQIPRSLLSVYEWIEFKYCSLTTSTSSFRHWNRLTQVIFLFSFKLFYFSLSIYTHSTKGKETKGTERKMLSYDLQVSEWMSVGIIEFQISSTLFAWKMRANFSHFM